MSVLLRHWLRSPTEAHSISLTILVSVLASLESMLPLSVWNADLDLFLSIYSDLLLEAQVVLFATQHPALQLAPLSDTQTCLSRTLWQVKLVSTTTDCDIYCDIFIDWAWAGWHSSAMDSFRIIVVELYQPLSLKRKNTSDFVCR